MFGSLYQTSLKSLRFDSNLDLLFVAIFSFTSHFSTKNQFLILRFVHVGPNCGRIRAAFFWSFWCQSWQALKEAYLALNLVKSDVNVVDNLLEWSTLPDGTKVTALYVKENVLAPAVSNLSDAWTKLNVVKARCWKCNWAWHCLLFVGVGFNKVPKSCL